MNERGIWTLESEYKTHVFDQSLCDEIISLFGLQNIVDIGAGNCAYTKYFNSHGIHCVGYDGAEFTPSPCKILDFTEPIDIGEHDLVLCLEVGEHIPKEYEQTFIDNLCNASREWLILSWAIPGQGGDGHVNCRKNFYVINEMQKRGMWYNAGLTRRLRESASVSWFKNTLMTFEWSR